MQTFIIRYTATEREIQQIGIVAESEEEALRIVKEYEFDNSEAEFEESLEWSISDVEVIKE